jgi:serine phosphatase RsbU (regulator of sigma subunit)
MPYVLVGTIGDKPFRHLLKEGEQSVGRTEGVDVRLEHDTVSRSHARITVEGSRIALTDLDSRNGTRVDGRPVSGTVELTHGCRIEFAGLVLSLVEEGREDEPKREDRVCTGGGSSTDGRHEYRLDDSSIECSSISIGDMSATGVHIGSDTSYNLFRVLADAGEFLTTDHPLEEICELVLDLVGRMVSTDRTLLLLIEDDGAEPVVTASRFRDAGESDGIVLSKTMLQKVLNDGEALLTTDAQQDSRFGGANSIVRQAIRSAMVAPLFDNENVIGVLYADTKDPASRYREDELRTFTALANIIAVKITQTRLAALEEERKRLERELSTARDIISNILPSEIESVPGYEMAVYHEPCMEVGGDLYDVRPLEDGRWVVLLGDVAGKGLGAALLVSCIVPVAQVLMSLPGDLAETAALINRQVWQSTDAVKYATLFIGVLDPSTGRLDYVNAGHNPPYLAAPDGTLSELASTGMPVGMVESVTYGVESVMLNPGAVLAIFSDGITEAGNESDQFYGKQRLMDVLVREHAEKADAILERVCSDVTAFAGERPQSDDITLLILRRSP